MTTEGGGSGPPPNSPVVSMIDPVEVSLDSQYEPNMAAEQPATGSGPPVAEEGDENMLRLVAKTVEVMMDKLLPQLQRPQYESSRRETVDDKKG
eukprot:6173745-Karenia_brevis.AAC.1